MAAGHSACTTRHGTASFLTSSTGPAEASCSRQPGPPWPACQKFNRLMLPYYATASAIPASRAQERLKGRHAAFARNLPAEGGVDPCLHKGLLGVPAGSGGRSGFQARNASELEAVCPAPELFSAARSSLRQPSAARTPSAAASPATLTLSRSCKCCRRCGAPWNSLLWKWTAVKIVLLCSWVLRNKNI